MYCYNLRVFGFWGPVFGNSLKIRGHFPCKHGSAQVYVFMHEPFI